MSQLSGREFSYNPSVMFARVERGEALEVTRHGTVIAVVMPGSGALGRYADLVSRGVIRLAEAPGSRRQVAIDRARIWPAATSPHATGR